MPELHFDPPQTLSLTLESASQDGALLLGSTTTVTGSYEALTDKPSIEGVTLRGDKSLPQIGVGLITPQDIDNIIYG